MKTIGFIKEQDADIVQKEFLNNVEEFNSLLISKSERKRIIDYLNNSVIVFSITLALFDGKNYISPYMLLSDGEWIWTNHFAYYLKKQNFSQMTKEFLNHIRNKNYKICSLSKKQRTDIDVFLRLELLNLDEKQRESIRRNAIELGYDV